MTDYEAVVYDLDNTLVRLAVDWDAVSSECAALLRERGIEPGADLWTMLEQGAAHGCRDAIADRIVEHERDGASDSERLPLADELPHELPTAVCSLNCEAACRRALRLHDLAAHVSAVVGRDTVATEKPDPEPLLAAIDSLGADPERSLFVGDSERDEVTAKHANVPFAYVEEYRATP